MKWPDITFPGINLLSISKIQQHESLEVNQHYYRMERSKLDDDIAARETALDEINFIYYTRNGRFIK